MRAQLPSTQTRKMKILPSPHKAGTGSKGSTVSKREESLSALERFSYKVLVVSESSNHWVVPLPRHRVAFREGRLGESVKCSPSPKTSSRPVFPEALFFSWEMGEVDANSTDLPRAFSILKRDPFVTPIAGLHFVQCSGNRGLVTVALPT
jgi:hypothetical protein